MKQETLKQLRTNKLKITCIISSLSSGGAEKVMTVLAGGLVRRGFDVTLLTIDQQAKDFYPMPEGVKRIKVAPEAARSCRWYDLLSQQKRKIALRESILATSPDLVISFLNYTNIIVLAALNDCVLPIIVAERTDIQREKLPFRWEMLRRIWYPKASQVVFLHSGMARWAKKFWPRWNTIVIPNPVFLNDDCSLRGNSILDFNFPFKIISVGRLAKEKNYDLLINAYAKITNDFPDWGLIILGEGPERSKLEEKIQQLDLSERILMPGTIYPPFSVLKQADLFVMSSHYEGFPNALVEAMACGLPVICTDCSSAIGDIIQHGVNGLIVPPGDVAALAGAMQELIKNKIKRREFGRQAVLVKEKYSLDNFLNQWVDLIENVLGTKKQ